MTYLMYTSLSHMLSSCCFVHTVLAHMALELQHLYDAQFAVQTHV